MLIATDKVATIHFTITDEKGLVQDSTEGQPPYSFIGSLDQMFPAVEEKLAGMEVGSKATLSLEPAEAYGEYDEDYVKVTDRAHFPDGVELKEGMTFLTQQEDEEVPVTIKKVDEAEVTIDFNHPMAGQKLKIDLELLEIRDATKEELDSGHIHGAGCNH